LKKFLKEKRWWILTIRAVMFCKLGISVINKVIEELKKIKQKRV